MPSGLCTLHADPENPRHVGRVWVGGSIRRGSGVTVTEARPAPPGRIVMGSISLWKRDQLLTDHDPRSSTIHHGEAALLLGACRFLRLLPAAANGTTH